MKKYLNQAEREDIVMLSALTGALENTFKKWKDRGNLTKDEYRHICIASGHLNSFINKFCNRLDPSFLGALIRDAKQNEIICVPTARAQIKMEQAKKTLDNEDMIVKRFVFETLAEKALGNCAPCKVKDKKNCELRAMLLEAGIPVLDEQAEECPYMMEG